MSERNDVEFYDEEEEEFLCLCVPLLDDGDDVFLDDDEKRQ